ncbi:hypothetical protein QQF64_034910 [Cirrhinus molitorella]|uniref:Uncharacterized protein n=1 Tax=Cirrhinus molitorella TaxID=172907 RepID=A0ABR3NEL5_9TELE
MHPQHSQSLWSKIRWSLCIQVSWSRVRWSLRCSNCSASCNGCHLLVRLARILLTRSSRDGGVHYSFSRGCDVHYNSSRGVSLLQRCLLLSALPWLSSVPSACCGGDLLLCGDLQSRLL